MVNIGAAAKASDLAIKTVRYYADVGLVRPSGRAENGYRQYGEAEIRKLVFVKRSRALGFSIDECRELLDLYENHSRASADVKRITAAKLQEIENKIHQLKQLQQELKNLAESCEGTHRPDCPILDSLDGQIEG